MNQVSPKTKHDFINNTLRIEVLNTLIADALDQKKEIPGLELDDLIRFTELHLQLLKEIKKNSNLS